MMETNEPAYLEQPKTARKRVFDEYKSTKTWKTEPITDLWLERFANEMLRWAQEDPKAWVADQFWQSRGVCNTTKERWIKVYPIIEKAHRETLIALGIKREIGALTKDLDTNMVAHMMWHYSKEWKDAAEFRASLRAKIEAQKRGPEGLKIVEVPVFIDAQSEPITAAEPITIKAEKPKRNPEETAQWARKGCPGPRYKRKKKE